MTGEIDEVECICMPSCDSLVEVVDASGARFMIPLRIVPGCIATVGGHGHAV